MKLLIILLMVVSFLQTRVGSFDHYMLAEVWPAGFCQTHTCIKKVNKFIIHGLWPQTKPAVDPSHCPETSELKLDGSLVRKLHVDWQSLTNTKDEVFWKAEWDKHGSCSMLEQNKYFEIASTVYRKHSIRDILKAKNIGDKFIAESLSKQVFEKAIKDGIGSKPQLYCDTQHNLVEVRLCLDKNDPYDFKDCSAASASCPDKGIIFQYSYTPHGVMTHDDPMDSEEKQLPRVMPPL
ncbi:intracellular ribonuclease LX-like [Vicia villosa]|uniref:intracellular ribonuclease LX-like n=1 Tax=Vicia villosa TaxID=3911 RepID=UPI00273B35EA|nr:intracellular ribonuclease LX-like [Vicia villosa]